MEISLHGWQIRQRDLHRSSCLFTVSTKFHLLIQNDNFYTNLVSKSWFLGVFADISARSSRGKNFFLIFHIRFFFRTISGVSGLVLPIFVVHFAVVHEIRLQKAFYVLWLAQLVVVRYLGLRAGWTSCHGYQQLLVVNS